MNTIGFSYYQQRIPSVMNSNFPFPITQQNNEWGNGNYSDTSIWHPNIFKNSENNIEPNIYNVVWLFCPPKKKNYDSQKYTNSNWINKNVLHNLKSDFSVEKERYKDHAEFCEFAEEICNKVSQFIAKQESIQDAALQFTRDMSVLFTLKKQDGLFSYFEVYYSRDFNNTEAQSGCVFLDADRDVRLSASYKELNGLRAESVLSFLTDSLRKTFSSVVI